MKKDPIQPQESITIQELDALKTLADPLRNKIMEVLTPEPHTVNQVAQKLGVESSKLYYHFSLLEKHGFIQVVETKQHGNLLEKHFWITAYHFKITEDKFNFNVDTPEGTEQIISLLLANIELTREDLRRSMYARHQQISQGAEKNPRSVLDKREIFNLPDDKAKEFQQRLAELIEEFKQEGQSLPSAPSETIAWALSVVFYPSFYFDPEQETTQGE